MSLASSVCKQGHVHALDAAGVLVIDALEDAGRVGRQGVGHRPAQVAGGQAFQHFVRHAVGGRQRQLEGVGVGDAGAVECWTA